jgi:hypothetical protein
MRLELFDPSLWLRDSNTSHRLYIKKADQRSSPAIGTNYHEATSESSERTHLGLWNTSNSKHQPASNDRHKGEQRDARDNKGTERLACLPRGMASLSVAASGRRLAD